MTEDERPHPGFEWAKRLKPLGAVIVLAVFVSSILLMVNIGKDPVPGYEAPHDSEYYASNTSTLLELKEELEENFFPRLQGADDCYIKAEKKDGILFIVTPDEKKSTIRAALLRYYDEELFQFIGFSEVS